MFRAFRKGGKDKEQCEVRLRFQANKVRTSKPVQVLVYPPDKNSNVARTSLLTATNGVCQWQETVCETVRLSRDKRSNGWEPKILKLVLSTGEQGRSGSIGEAAINVAEAQMGGQVEEKGIVLKNCPSGTILNVTIQCVLLGNQRDEGDDAVNDGEELGEQDVDTNFMEPESLQLPDAAGRAIEPQKFRVSLADLSSGGDMRALPDGRRLSHGGSVSPEAETKQGTAPDNQYVPGPSLSSGSLGRTSQKVGSFQNRLGEAPAGDEAAVMPGPGAEVVASLQREVDTWQRKAYLMQSELDSLRQQLSASEVSRTGRDADLAASLAECSTLSSDLESLRQQLRASEASGSGRDAELAASMAECSTLRAELESLRQQLGASEASGTGREAELAASLAECGTLRERVAELEKGDHASLVVQLQQEVEKLREDQAQAREGGQDRETDLKEEIERLNAALKKSEDSARAAGRLIDSEVQRKLVLAQEQNMRLQQEVQNLSAKMGPDPEMVRRMEELEKEAQEATQESLQLAQDLSRAQATLKVKEAQLAAAVAAKEKGYTNDVSSEAEVARARIQELEAESKKAREAHASQVAALESAEAQVRVLQEKCTSMEERVRHVEEAEKAAQAKMTEAELEMAGAGLWRKAKEGGAMRQMAEVNPELLRALESEVAHLRGVLAEREAKANQMAENHRKEVAEVEGREMAVKKSSRALANEVEELKREVERLRAKLAEEEGRVARVEESLAKERADKEASLKRMEEELGRVATELEAAGGGGTQEKKAVVEAAALRGAHVQLEERMKELEKELEESRKAVAHVKDVEAEVRKLSQEREQLNRQVEWRDEELVKLRAEKQATTAKMMAHGMRKKSAFSPPGKAETVPDLKAKIEELEETLAEKEKALLAALKKAASAEILAATAIREDPFGSGRLSLGGGPMIDANDPTAGIAAPTDENNALYRRIRALETTLAQTKEESRQAEKALRDQIAKLEVANEQLIGPNGMDVGTEQLQGELMRLQSQNASMRNRERELTVMLNAQQVLESEVERLQELNEELEQRLTVQRDVMEGVKTVERLEMELYEANEAIKLYKQQLKNALANEENVGAAALLNLGTPDQVIEELQSTKKKNQALEADLGELRQRYSEMSLRLLEVEERREELVMAIRSLKMNSSLSQSRLLDSLGSFGGMLGSAKASGPLLATAPKSPDRSEPPAPGS